VWSSGARPSSSSTTPVTDRPARPALSDHRAFRIAVIDDDPVITAIIGAALAAAGFGAPAVAATGADGLALEADLILLDLHLPDAPGFDVLARLRARAQPPAVVVITAHGSETVAAQALRLGADDYLVKDAALVDLLPQVVERQRRTIALRRALAAAEQDLLDAERMAAVGEMTVTLHHSINNPLMAAGTEVELLLRDPALTPDQRESLANVRNSLKRIGEVVRRAGELREARSTDYLEGQMRMVDLREGGAGTRLERGRAVVAIADRPLARIIGHLLKGAGFSVDACEPEAFAPRRPAPLVSVVQAGTVPAERVAGGAGGELTVVVGPPPALAAYDANSALLIATPFDPGAAIEEILRRLEGRGP
jgi:DNA-binding response OmpR family regulator